MFGNKDRLSSDSAVPIQLPIHFKKNHMEPAGRDVYLDHLHTSQRCRIRIQQQWSALSVRQSAAEPFKTTVDLRVQNNDPGVWDGVFLCGQPLKRDLTKSKYIKYGIASGRRLSSYWMRWVPRRRGTVVRQPKNFLGTRSSR